MSKRLPLQTNKKNLHVPDTIEIHLYDDVIITCKKSEFTLENNLISCLEYTTKHRLDVPLTSVLYVTDLTPHDMDKEIEDLKKATADLEKTSS